MALSDSDLLALLAKAENGQKGAKGEQGVSITSIKSPEPGKLVIGMSDGSVYNFSFPAIKGERGEQGPQGEPGIGSRGPAGAQGPAGSDGRDGVGIDSALVSNGSLLIGLSDGRAIDAGRVAGPVGPVGPAGQDGIGRPVVEDEDGGHAVEGSNRKFSC